MNEVDIKTGQLVLSAEEIRDIELWKDINHEKLMNFISGNEVHRGSGLTRNNEDYRRKHENETTQFLDLEVKTFKQNDTSDVQPKTIHRSEIIILTINKITNCFLSLCFIAGMIITKQIEIKQFSINI